MGSSLVKQRPNSSKTWILKAEVRSSGVTEWDGGFPVVDGDSSASVTVCVPGHRYLPPELLQLLDFSDNSEVRRAGIFFSNLHAC